MTSLTLAVLLHTSSAGVDTRCYADAHRATAQTGKPILVMVSAKWCGPCQKMEKDVLPRVAKRGLLKKVSFAIVNVDRERTLAKKLIGRGSVPQLVMYRRNGKGWLRRRLVGGQSPEAVEKFIKQGIAKDQATKTAAKAGKDSPPAKQRPVCTIRREPSDTSSTCRTTAARLQSAPCLERGCARSVSAGLRRRKSVSVKRSATTRDI